MSDEERTKCLQAEQGGKDQGPKRRPGPIVVGVCIVVFTWLALLLGRWLVIIDLYGDSDCTTSRSKLMCYCTYFNDSWSCPDNSHKLDKKYSFGYWKGDEHLTEGSRLEMYLGWSTAEEIIRNVVVAILLVTRIWAVRCSKNTDKSADSVVRTNSTYKELQLQLRIAAVFLLWSTVHKLVVMIMVGQCDSPTKGGLQQSSTFFKTMFMYLAAMYLAVEVKIGRKQVPFSMPLPRRCACGFLGLCSLSLVIDTLVQATCLEDVSNENVHKVWIFLKPLCYAAAVGMYGQYFTMFVHIAIEPTEQSDQTASQGETGGKNSDESQKENLKRCCQMVLHGVGLFVVTITITLTAVFIVDQKHFGHVPVLQIVLHGFVIISSCGALFVHLRSWWQSRSDNSDGSGCSCLGCVWKLIKWLFRGDPERLVYGLFFISAFGYNCFALVIYTKHGNHLNDTQRANTGIAESVFAMTSVLLQFMVILFLKLLGEHAHKYHQPWWMSWMLKFLLTVSASLAVADIIREEFDLDEKFFVNVDRTLFIYYDFLYPLAVDFRLHSAIMLFYIVLEDRLRNRQHA